MISKQELINKQVRIAKLDYEWKLYGRDSILRDLVERVTWDAEQLAEEVARLGEERARSRDG